MEDGQKLLVSCSHLSGSLFGEEMKYNSLPITWVGLFNVGTLFDADLAVRIARGLAVCAEAILHRDAWVVFAHVGVDVLDVVGDDLAQAGDFLAQGVHALLEHVGEVPSIEAAKPGIQPAHAGDGRGHVEAVGLGHVEVGTEAEFEDQERVIEQVSAPAGWS